MEEIARVYATALFGAAKDKGKLDAIRDQLGQFADALAENRDMQLFFFSPYFSSAEKSAGLGKAQRKEGSSQFLPDDRIEVRRADHPARFVRTATMRPFLQLLRQKILKEGDLS